MYDKVRLAVIPESPRVCVCHEATMMNKPILVRTYWPTGRWVNQDWEDSWARRKLFQQSPSSYTLMPEVPFRGMAIPISLIDGDKTEAVKVEEESVPPPKTRVETRWWNGRWEKYLKREGWVSA